MKPEGNSTTADTFLDRLLAVPSVQHALKAEKLLKSSGIRVIMIPTPREIALSCGQCLLFSSDRQEECLILLQSGNIHWTALYRREAAQAVNTTIRWHYEKLTEGVDERSDKLVERTIDH
jgi:hypothetical protein